MSPEIYRIAIATERGHHRRLQTAPGIPTSVVEECRSLINAISTMKPFCECCGMQKVERSFAAEGNVDVTWERLLG